jgi:hypothetical protein
MFTAKNDGGTYVDDGGRLQSAVLGINKMESTDRAALDAASGVYTNAVQYSGATAAGRGVAIICTVAGNATLTFAGGGSMVIPVAVGFTSLPFACTNAVQTSGTMTLYKLT